MVNSALRNLKAGTYTVYSDASAYTTARGTVCSGAGALIINTATGQETYSAISLEGKKNTGSSVVAEFYAAALALDFIPARSTIRFLTDSLSVARYLQRREITPAQTRDVFKPKNVFAPDAENTEAKKASFHPKKEKSLHPVIRNEKSQEKLLDAVAAFQKALEGKNVMLDEMNLRRRDRDDNSRRGLYIADTLACQASAAMQRAAEPVKTVTREDTQKVPAIVPLSKKQAQRQNKLQSMFPELFAA